MNTKRLVVLSAGMALLAGGAGYSSIPIIALLGLPLAAVGALMVGGAAFAFRDPQAAAARQISGAFFLVIGTIALLLGCLSAVGDVQGHLLAVMRQEMIAKRTLNPDPDLRFLAGWRLSVETLTLWLGPPCLLYIGVMLRQGVSKLARSLLILYWLASAPLAVLVFLSAYLGGEPLTA